MSESTKLSAEDVQRLTADLEHADDELGELQDEAKKLSEQAKAAKGADKKRLEDQCSEVVKNVGELEEEIEKMRAQLDGHDQGEGEDAEKAPAIDQNAAPTKGETVHLRLLFPGPRTRLMRGRIVKVHKGGADRRVDVEYMPHGLKQPVVTTDVPYGTPNGDTTPAWHH